MGINYEIFPIPVKNFIKNIAVITLVLNRSAKVYGMGPWLNL